MNHFPAMSQVPAESLEAANEEIRRLQNMDAPSLIERLKSKALSIMREDYTKQTTEERANRLEIAGRYMICCVILNNEIDWKDLPRI